MVRGYSSLSPSSSPPTPPPPLPVSVGPAHHHYYLYSSPSLPFSPPSSPHAASFSVDQLQLQPHHNEHHSTCSSCLLHLLKWFLQRCCTSASKTMTTRETAKPDRLCWSHC